MTLTGVIGCISVYKRQAIFFTIQKKEIGYIHT